ncbi:hypothetical protein SCZ71_04150 [Legionella pneumophila serogroup 1]|uniref:Uncharacterized protein n=1 Tax=Legionella pneumophila TaxID=446 RepID=A0A378K8W0_LEGPN|nr:hypothetical protein [Legionella pneumophila]ABQ54048.1 hypothetical protein LPC_0048 [Legionella pneumophila str. Corby]MCO1452535.1 hypothetical protein [Legionella pneumophila]MCW8400989.1 hypothetical protein [Legionella pneumophila]MCW8435375.1 hypothetical protein [Legionella pneumophila]MCW8455997.1 hypothetical protein [Legionella pneumophila]
MNCFPFFAKKNKKNNEEKAEKTLSVFPAGTSINKTTVKEICFTDIFCDTHPFVWYYYPEHNLAIWTSRLAGTTQEYPVDYLLNQLAKIPGITIDQGDAAIKDVSTFLQDHQMIPIRNSESWRYIKSSSFSMS